MRFGRGNAFVRGQDLRRALLQLSAQVRPFVKQLAVGFFQHDHSREPRNFRTVEFITAPRGLFVHGFEEGSERCHGFCVGLKPDELRVMPVAFGFAAQDLLRQQRLPPERDESLGVEVFRVQGPKPHGENLTITAQDAKNTKSPVQEELAQYSHVVDIGEHSAQISQNMPVRGRSKYHGKTQGHRFWHRSHRPGIGPGVAAFLE
jgi:hypothetical protein